MPRLAMSISLAGFATASACTLLTDVDKLHSGDGGIDAVAETSLDAVVDTGGGHNVPPPPPADGAATSNVRTFAIQRVYLGDTDRLNDPPSTSAWAGFGYDLDGKISTASSNDVCILASGASATVQADGDRGTDNSWGANIVPLMKTFVQQQNVSTSASQAIAGGAWTLLLQVTGLSDDATQAALGLSAQVFVGANYGSAPVFDTSTDWPVRKTSLVNGTIVSGAKVQFQHAYMNQGTFVSGASTSPLTFLLVFNGAEMPLVIHDAVITFDHVDHGDATNGVIAGVLDTNELLGAIKSTAGAIQQSFCTSFPFSSQIIQASDILDDASNAPNVACQGISIGLGFTAVLVANPTTVFADPPPVDPCAD